MVRPARLELATFGFGDQRSIHLSYGRGVGMISGQPAFGLARENSQLKRKLIESSEASLNAIPL